MLTTKRIHVYVHTAIRKFGATCLFILYGQTVRQADCFISLYYIKYYEDFLSVDTNEDMFDRDVWILGKRQ